MELRPITIDDLPLYESLHCDPVMMAELGGPLPREGQAEKLRRDVEAVEAGECWIFKIMPDGETGVAAGTVGVWDPIYRFAADEIARRIDETYSLMVAGMETDRDRFVWTYAGSPKRHAEQRMAAMRRFLDDFPQGLRDGRYVAEALPTLSFPADSFDLALSSHFLFLYSAQLSLDLHLAAIAEMLRVARQVRIFPLLDLAGDRSRHVHTSPTHPRNRWGMPVADVGTA